MDSTQDLIGNIKQIEVNTIDYPINKKDTIVNKEHSIVFFDERNRIIKQIDFYKKFTDETYFNYKNNLLENMISKIDKRIRKTEYKYDNKNNIIEYNELENDTLFFKKTSVYDNKNNPVELRFFYPNSKYINSIEKFTYDYKHSIVNIESFDENNKPKNYYVIIHFNEKGYIVKTEFIYRDSNIGHSNISILEYDKQGNLTKRNSVDKDGKLNETRVYKNTYDQKGNIIIREEYWKDKVIKKTTSTITYR